MASLPLVRRHQDAADEKPEITKRGIMEALISVRGAAASSASPRGTSASSALSRTRSFLAALTLASLACSMLRQVFDLFYVETFLTAYELPLSSFSFGTFVYTIIDVVNDVGAAYFVDAYALRSSRGAIGRSGCLLALCFLAPFFRGGRRIKESPFLATSHFIISVSSYDTLLTFLSMLIGSYFTDNAHTLSESTRINFTASGKICNLIGSFIVGRVGLELFDTDDMKSFRVHVLILSGVACALFVLAQRLMYRATDKDHESEKGDGRSNLNLRRLVADLCRSENFLSFVAMEALLEAENEFSAGFGKIFFDRLITGGSVGGNGGQYSCCNIASIPSSVYLAVYADSQDRLQTDLQLFVSRENLSFDHRSGTVWLVFNDGPHHVPSRQSNSNSSGADILFLLGDGGSDNVAKIQASETRAHG